MADQPPKEFPEHGGSGNAEFGAGWPDNELTTPNVRGRRFPPVEPSSFSNDYGSHPTGHVHPPTDPDAIGIGAHPFKLEVYSKVVTEDERGRPLIGDALDPSNTRLTLRVYYGELWSTVSVIRTESKTEFGIKSQDAIQGVQRTVLPDFEHEDLDSGRQYVLRYTEFSESIDRKGESDGGAYGVVVLEWVCNADPGEEGEEKDIGITSAQLVLIPAGEEVSSDSELGELSRHEHDVDGEDVLELMRIAGDTEEEAAEPEDADETDTETGIYRMVIGESLDPNQLGPRPEGEQIEGGGGPAGLGGDDEILVNEGKPPIDQQVVDHIYWAPTIVIGAAAPKPDGYTTTSIVTNLVVNLNSSKKKTEPLLVAPDIPVDHRVVINPNRNIIDDQLGG